MLWALTSPEQLHLDAVAHKLSGTQKRAGGGEWIQQQLFTNMKLRSKERSMEKKVGSYTSSSSPCLQEMGRKSVVWTWTGW